MGFTQNELNVKSQAGEMIHLEAKIDKDLDLVWLCWTTPEHIVNWNFASEDWQCTKAKNSLTVGGRFAYYMASKDGQHGFDFAGIHQ